MILKKLAALILTAATALSLSLPAEAEDGKFLTLKTSNNPTYTAVLTCSGDTVSASGSFRDDPPVRVGFLNGNESNLTFNAEADGSFTGSAEKPGPTDEVEKFYIELTSGVQLAYLIRYDDGWYFPDNGLAEKNYSKFSDIKPAAPEAAGYYLSPTGDPAEISETLNRIRDIAAEISAETDDPYEQAKLVCSWVAENIYYDHDAAEEGIDLGTVAVANVLDIKRTTCAGFANTTCAIFEALGIRSVNIKASISNNYYPYDGLLDGVENHEFTAFWYEKEQRWVYVDACWCGGNNFFKGEFYNGPSDLMYFDITGEALSLNHRADKVEERFYFQALNALNVDAEAEATIAATPQSSENSGSVTTSILVLILVLCLGSVAMAIITIYIIKKRNGKRK